MKPPSSYYPPRSRNAVLRSLRPVSYWFRRLASGFSFLNIEVGSLTLPPAAILVSLLVPGYIFRATGPKRIFPWMLSAYGVATLIYFVWFGYTASSLAYMAILSLHVTSVAQLFKHLTPSAGLKFRMLTSITIFLLMFWGVYGFLQQQLSRVVVPMRMDGKVIVARACAPETISVGEMIAYSIAGRSSAGLRVQEGMGIDRVLGRAGDTIRFTETTYQVNGVVFERLSHMPKTGEWMVPPATWFVWPSMSVSGNNYAAETATSELMMYSMISKEAFIGKPCKYWFWRKQF